MGLKEHHTSIRQVTIKRFTVVSSMPFERVVAMIEAAVGRPDMTAFLRDIAAVKTLIDLESIIHKAIGPSGLMEFARFDIGEIMRKEHSAQKPRILRFVIGNPLIMKQMVVKVPDAASYAPVTVLIDERPDGVHLSYDRMASLLAPYESEEALKVARELDAKIEAMLTAAAAGTKYAPELRE